ncbi:MAG: hypothetical protein JKY31_13120 [Rhodobacteraceae bacterium]|nr:hypothetical protein [Paracoccaceae bacterium]
MGVKSAICQQQLKVLIGRGMLTGDIALQLGVVPNTIRQFCRRRGLVLPRKMDTRRPLRTALAAQCETMTLGELVKHYGVSHAVIHAWLGHYRLSPTTKSGGVVMAVLSCSPAAIARFDTAKARRGFGYATAK